eukprot:5571766-Ditylum_brightwellii.AAC.1
MNNNESNNNDNETLSLDIPLVSTNDNNEEEDIWEVETVVEFQNAEEFWNWYWTVFFLYDYVWAAPQA